MRKMTARIPSTVLDCCSSLSGIIESCEVVSLFKLTPRTHIEVCRITLAKGASIDDVKNGFIDDLIVLKDNGRCYTCLIKGAFSDELSKFLGLFDLKLEYPIIYDERFIQFSVVGSSRELSAITVAVKESFCDLEVLSVHPYDPHISSVFDALTQKQKDILLQAYRLGYFDHPRKINADTLAKKMGIHKTTLLEHLHKAERNLIRRIIEQTS